MKLKPYLKYNPSGVEWLGDVPAHWDVKRLKRDLAVLTERSERRSNAVGLENIEGWSGRFIQTDTEFDGEGIAFEPGDILFGKLRPYLAKVFLARSPGEAVGDFHVLHPSANVDGRYATYTMLTREFISIVDGSTFGAKMPRAGWDFLGSMFWCLPPRVEQSIIAAFLDCEIGKIDTLIAKQEKLIELLQEKRQTVISHAVMKGLDPNVPMKPSGVEWLGDVPEHWQTQSMKRIATIRYGIGEPPTYRPEGTPLVRATNVHAGKLFDKDMVFVDPQDIPASRIVWLMSGDIVVVRSGAYTGDSAIIPEDYGPCIAGFDMVLRCHSVSPKFVQYALLSKYLKEGQLDLEKMRAAQPHLNAEELGACVVAMPPIFEQDTILIYLDHATTKIDTLIAKAQQAIELQKEHRTALISAAVTGKIDVRGLVESNVSEEKAA